MERRRAAGKFLRSFLTPDWSLENYPVRVLQRSGKGAGRRKPFTWTAQIVDWWHMRGDGFRREEALQRLRERFAAYKAANPLPRPGGGAPFECELAAADVIEANREIVDDLLRRVIGMELADCLVTDESSLWDFHNQESNAPYLEKIRDLYGVEAVDDPPTLAAPSTRIRERRGA
jgi:hypothetical protein